MIMIMIMLMLIIIMKMIMIMIIMIIRILVVVVMILLLLVLLLKYYHELIVMVSHWWVPIKRKSNIYVVDIYFVNHVGKIGSIRVMAIHVFVRFVARM